MAKSALRQLHTSAVQARRRLIDAILPPRCLATGEIVDRQGQLSAAAWREIDFIAPPLCDRCGIPFAFETGLPETAICAACIAHAPRYDRARGVFRYDSVSRNMILAFKSADRLEGAPAFAKWMARAGADLLPDADLIVPVPLHVRRLFGRRYNQSAVLALALGRLCERPVAVDFLVRTRHTPQLGGLSASARRRQLSGAIRVRPGRESEVAERNVLIIDDVLTSGATTEACARVLKRAGAARVDVLTLARVVRGAAASI